jgi:hypothetical protein
MYYRPFTSIDYGNCFETRETRHITLQHPFLEEESAVAQSLSTHCGQETFSLELLDSRELLLLFLTSAI